MSQLHIKEGIAKALFVAAAGISVLAVALICVFLFANGVPALAQIGLPEFLFGTTWRPANDIYGIFPMIVGSIYVTAGAMVVGVPTGLLCAIFLSRFASGKIAAVLKPGVELLAGIPSVVYGFFGLVILVPFVRANTPDNVTGNGLSLLAASVLLGIMILPTIITVAQSALDAVPKKYYEGSLALGADHERSVFRVIVPAATSGIMASIVLGVGRAIGETMAVIMVAGNQALIPESIFSGVRTMTANIVLEMGYAADLHRGALVATGVVLFVFILLITMLFNVIKKRGEMR
ncbi:MULTISPECIES: phosphate ABC transporter permease subunit PstC [Eggerthella]|jgi:phosphate transport system permease protein|uniref:Phosphate transport system permease protein n=1 Tax=Eggerthella lenta TaxID=84112 RepID=A0A369MS04_EGGLN|nr:MULTISPECIES: phosphate ABC transporter permease subunit PstC [Eggerthella]MBU9892281.1 phosphate ABC transporter permease subunit PstC [Eggerthella lenta]MBV4056700.1 phosphate ABC transporter permease subunit PstC [Eggerthella lenta]MBV4104187.1 phosphate ABC transporter permease subunit PstC [Eggerthella lenta]MBV4127594.1 phosphate ABC transporter permease subunit PstC [Eggerthella lenta]MBV4141741.1 phosphate ABC transporter permease subunit PstC [Eggerthella lenta]